jgi:hypothetical protein
LRFNVLCEIQDHLHVDTPLDRRPRPWPLELRIQRPGRAGRARRRCWQ